jgi:hypothetical protein
MEFFFNIISADEYKQKLSLQQFLDCQKLKSVIFTQLKPVSDILSCGLTLSSCPRYKIPYV